MDFKSQLRNKELDPQTVQILMRLKEFMTEEAKNPDVPTIPLNRVTLRLTKATCLSLSSVSRIEKEKRDIKNGVKTHFVCPLSKRIRPNHKTVLASNDQRLIFRNIVYNYYLTHRKVPTGKHILDEFGEATGYGGKETSFYTLIKNMGFYFRRTGNSDNCKRRILLERPEQKLQRINYLRTIAKYRQLNRTLVFLDETYLLPQQANEKSWDGQKLIIVHAFFTNGCIPNSCLFFQSAMKGGDYYKDLNYKNFERWLVKKLLPNLPGKSVIVIGSAPFKNVQLDETCPSYSSLKETMIQWLQAKNVSFDIDMTKAELYDLIKHYKSGLKTFQIDHLFTDLGHSVLRIPQSQPDLNPNELVWTSLKQHVAQSYVTYELNEVISLAGNFIKKFSGEEWTAKLNSIADVEKNNLQREIDVDNVIDEIIREYGICDETDEDEENYEDDDDLSDKE